MKIFVETMSGKIISDYCFKGYIGALNKNRDVELISLPKVSMMMDKVKLEKPMPIGCISFMEYFFSLYDMNKPVPIHQTSNLMSGLYEVVDKKSQIKYPAFVKPHNDVKKFTGFVANSIDDFNYYPELEDWDGPYFVRKPFDHLIFSEWRCFVHRNKLVNCSFYTGEFPSMFPDGDVINNLIKNYKNAPVSYSLDVAVLENSETVLVELNDMWSIAPYGCDETKYFAMLEDRWLELINS